MWRGQNKTVFETQLDNDLSIVRKHGRFPVPYRLRPPYFSFFTFDPAGPPHPIAFVHIPGANKTWGQSTKCHEVQLFFSVPSTTGIFSLETAGTESLTQP